MKLLSKVILLLCLLTTTVHGRISDGNEGPNGGDDISIEFITLAKVALKEIEAEKPELLKKFSLKQARKQLETLKVVITDKNQYLDIDGHQQSVVAVNYPEASLVIVHTEKWKAISKIQLKKALVLHELLSLIGVEDSGLYPVSSAYLGETLSVTGQVCKLEQKESFQAEAAGKFAIQHLPFPGIGGRRIVVMPLAADTKKALQDFAKALKIPKSKDIKGLDLLVWPQCNVEKDPKYRFGYFCYSDPQGIKVDFVYNDGTKSPYSGGAGAVILVHETEGEVFSLGRLSKNPGVHLTYRAEEMSCD